MGLRGAVWVLWLAGGGVVGAAGGDMGEGPQKQHTLLHGAAKRAGCGGVAVPGDVPDIVHLGRGSRGGALWS